MRCVQLDDSKSSSASKLSIDDSLGAASARDSLENALEPSSSGHVVAQRALSNVPHAHSQQPAQRPGTFGASSAAASGPSGGHERERGNAAAGLQVGAPGPQRRHISQSKSVSAVSREADSGLLVLESDPDAVSRPPVAARPEKTKSIVCLCFFFLLSHSKQKQYSSVQKRHSKSSCV